MFRMIYLLRIIQISLFFIKNVSSQIVEKEITRKNEKKKI